MAAFVTLYGNVSSRIRTWNDTGEVRDAYWHPVSSDIIRIRCRIFLRRRSPRQKTKVGHRQPEVKQSSPNDARREILNRNTQLTETVLCSPLDGHGSRKIWPLYQLAAHYRLVKDTVGYISNLLSFSLSLEWMEEWIQNAAIQHWQKMKTTYNRNSDCH